MTDTIIQGDRVEIFARGLNAGWDEANYSEAYGQDQTVTDQAAIRARELYDVGAEAGVYADGFCEGAERYLAGQWQDGSPRNND